MLCSIHAQTPSLPVLSARSSVYRRRLWLIHTASLLPRCFFIALSIFLASHLQLGLLSHSRFDHGLEPLPRAGHTGAHRDLAVFYHSIYRRIDKCWVLGSHSVALPVKVCASDEESDVVWEVEGAGDEDHAEEEEDERVWGGLESVLIVKKLPTRDLKYSFPEK